MELIKTPTNTPIKSKFSPKLNKSLVSNKTNTPAKAKNSPKFNKKQNGSPLKSPKKINAVLNKSVDIKPNVVRVMKAIDNGEMSLDSESEEEVKVKEEINDVQEVDENNEGDDINDGSSENSDNDDDDEDDKNSDDEDEEGPLSDDDEEDEEEDNKIVSNKRKKIQEQAAASKKQKLNNGKERFNINHKDDNTTIFVGNICVTTDRKQLTQLFKKYGEIFAVRIRSIPIADTRIPREVAAKTKQIHPEGKSQNAYIRFQTRESAVKALELNGTVHKGRHLRIDLLKKEQNEGIGSVNSIFIGNVCMKADEEELWSTFECCGKIESVRLIRDKRTNCLKGFGYVNFESNDSVELALQMEPVLNGRQLRVKRYAPMDKRNKNKKPNNKQVGQFNKKPFNKKRNDKNTSTTAEHQGELSEDKKPFSPRNKKFDKKNQKNKLTKTFKPKAKKPVHKK